MNSNEYDELLIRVEEDLKQHKLVPIISDTVPLYQETQLEGVAFLKGRNAFIFVDKNLSIFDKAKTLVEEYFHAISDLGNHLDYDELRASNDEVEARAAIIEYMTDEQTILNLVKKYPDQSFEPWMIMDELGYDLEFAEETVAYYERQGMIN
ncbi:hypothetical protein G7084_06705 [Weissella coleopterorum]|uniref:ImmA/IrrE family metallo-endopeptidase n=1 Tax=Weissella coleopterorum TaxID=2714949 RepID=A0A6G8B1B0_9LACO|nr:hypothetical protein [Weissella coleopterorum]QIL51012.1 hypothetical protein G7084_06705 [Weissella coleopterorum]